MRDPSAIDAGDLFQRIVLQTATGSGPTSRGRPVVRWDDSITAATWSASVATFTIQGTLPGTFVVGVTVVVTGMVPEAWNGTYTVVAVPGAAQFTVALAGNPGGATILGLIQFDPAPGTPVRCKVETPTGRKLEMVRQLVPTATHLVTMRYRALNENLNRLVYKTGRIFNIGLANDVLEKHVMLEVLCTELKPEP